jgi:hypothetical protein
LGRAPAPAAGGCRLCAPVRRAEAKDGERWNTARWPSSTARSASTR